MLSEVPSSSDILEGYELAVTRENAISITRMEVQNSRESFSMGPMWTSPIY